MIEKAYKYNAAVLNSRIFNRCNSEYISNIFIRILVENWDKIENVHKLGPDPSPLENVKIFYLILEKFYMKNHFMNVG